ncbi:ATP-binding protein [Geobacter sp.]|uniref:AAA family ATPase n=1 Tax=Geobacter sp. TaxID=46610 RepID=UPI002621BBB7|nr:ATP-binding protein [Geobacter sp.]
MITKLKIEGFKGFEELEVSRLSRISLLGGRNNVGKTSILEALFMFHDRLNPQMILRQFALRGVGAISFDPESMWAPVFYNYDLNKKISIVAAVNSDEEKMTIKFNPHYVLPSIPATAMRPGVKPTQIRTDQKPEPSFALDLVYDSKKMKNQTAHLLMGVGGIGIHIDKASMESRPAAFLGARVATNPSEDAQKFGQLDILGKQDKIVDFLRIIEPNLKSLSSVAMGDSSLIHGDIGLSRKIPVSYMGDGVSRLLSIILAIATANKGIVIVDEFENGIHYSAMSKIWEAVSIAAREYDCQVIGTTHSYECLEAAYKGIPEDLRNDFSYVRVDRTDNKTTAKCFDYELLKVAIETNMEVR